MLRNSLIILNIVAVAFVVGLAIAAWVSKNRRKATPPNLTKFYDDDVLEGPRLEKILGMALFLSAAVALSLPLYWLFVPSKVHAAFEDQFAEQSVERGHALFTGLGCSGCHGADGGGGFAPVVMTASDGTPFPGEHLAPALNTELLRFSEDEVFQTITYGRPGTPMAGWGIAGNGALNDQSIQDLVNYIASIQKTPEEAQAIADQQLATAREEAEARGNGDATDGELLFNINCARCHTMGYSRQESYYLSTALDPPPVLVSGGGAFGPNLRDCSEVRQFPDEADQIDFVTTGSDFQRGYGVRGIGSGRMPGFGQMLSADQIQQIVEYERSLGVDDPSDCTTTSTTSTTTASGTAGSTTATSGSSGTSSTQASGAASGSRSDSTTANSTGGGTAGTTATTAAAGSTATSGASEARGTSASSSSSSTSAGVSSTTAGPVSSSSTSASTTPRSSTTGSSTTGNGG